MASEAKGDDGTDVAPTVADEVTTDEPLKSKSKLRLKANMTITDNPAEVFVVKWSPEGNMLAAGLGDGSIRVFNTDTGYTHLLNTGHKFAFPVTSLRFRPMSTASKTKNVLLSVNADGQAQHWHITSGKLLHTIDPASKGNQLYCVDYNPDGSQFATAGKDLTIRLYDEATKSLVTELSGGIPDITTGHSNRVFSLKFVAEDPNLLVSGGWDNTVQVWDVRAGLSVRSIFGPFIGGDGVDVHDGVVLTGSYRQKEMLQTWDLGTCELIEEIPWGSTTSMLYCAEFSKDKGGSLIAAGGCKSHTAKVFDRNHGNALVGTIGGMDKGIFSLDFSCTRQLAIAGGDCAVRIFDVVKPPKSASASDLDPLTLVTTPIPSAAAKTKK